VTRRAETRDYWQVVYEVQAAPWPASPRSGSTPTSDLTRPRLVTQPGQALDESVASEDARSLARVAERAGHAGARVEVVAPEGGGDVPVVFRVQAGTRTLVASVNVETPVTLPARSAARELLVRAGSAYRIRDVARDRNALLTAYRDAGYPQAEVTPETTFSEDRREAKVVLRVVPGPRLSVDHVVVAGLERTEEEVVRREITLKEGEPLGQQEVIESQRRLGALGLFQKVSVAEIDPETAGQRTVLVTAEEGPLTTVSYGLGYSEADLLRGSVEVTRRNLFGMDRAITAFARLSFKGSRFLLCDRRRRPIASDARSRAPRP
jgi:outer membrane protein insertion porin family